MIASRLCVQGSGPLPAVTECAHVSVSHACRGTWLVASVVHRLADSTPAVRVLFTSVFCQLGGQVARLGAIHLFDRAMQKLVNNRKAHCAGQNPKSCRPAPTLPLRELSVESQHNQALKQRLLLHAVRRSRSAAMRQTAISAHIMLFSECVASITHHVWLFE